MPVWSEKDREGPNINGARGKGEGAQGGKGKGESPRGHEGRGKGKNNSSFPRINVGRECRREGGRKVDW